MTSYDKDFVRARNRGQAQRAWAAFCAVLMVVLFPWDDTTAAGQPRGQVFSVPEGVVQNGRFVETETGVIEVTYDLVSSASDALFAVELYVSEDGQNFVQATSVTGDIGSGIAPRYRQAYYLAMDERPRVARASHRSVSIPGSDRVSFARESSPDRPTTR